MSHQIILESSTILESIAKTVVVNEKNEILVLTIGEYEGHPEKTNQPDLPGGQVEIGDGEAEKAGAIREAEEEAGIVIDPKDLFLGYSRTHFFEPANKSISWSLYIAHLDYTPDVVISWEHANYEWVPADKLLETKTFPHFYNEAITYAFEHDLI